jgi:hypothetical protein
LSIARPFASRLLSVARRAILPPLAEQRAELAINRSKCIFGPSQGRIQYTASAAIGQGLLHCGILAR